jgi:hypothetical protein
MTIPPVAMRVALLRWSKPARDPGGAIMLNRAALICRYKQPFVDWINAVDPSPSSHTLSLAEVNEEHTVYLVEVQDEAELAAWLVLNHRELFEAELRGGCTSHPRHRRYRLGCAR